MPQRFYFDENDLNGTVEKLSNNLNDMLDFAYLHEDMVNTIDELMSDWVKKTYQHIHNTSRNTKTCQKTKRNGMMMLTNTYQSLDDGGWSHSKAWTMRRN